MIAHKPKWPWESARQRADESGDAYDARLDRLFISWVNDEIERRQRAWEDQFDPALELEREKDPKLHAAIRGEVRLARVAPDIAAAVKLPDREKRIEALTRLMTDNVSVRYALEKVWKPRGGQKGRQIKKGQPAYTEDKREMLREMASDVRLIRRVLRKNGIRRPRVGPEEIAVERATGDPDRKKWLLRDLRNFMKNL